MLSRNEFIEMRIEFELDKHPLLYTRFSVSKNECLEKIKGKYVEILDYINTTYPKNHIFRNKHFIVDALLFSLSYSAYITESFMSCPQIIHDFIEKKLVSNTNGRYDHKLFNEGASEFQIFMYLFTSIYFRSSLYKSFLTLEYESQASNNKRFEYTFCFNDIKLNLEVKALTCDPFQKDNINIMNLRHGELFYKSYFSSNIEDIIPINIRESATKLQSNYRQLNKNIKKISDKCSASQSQELNIGFIMINYGTSINEYISYLLHPKNGIIHKNGLGNIDLLVLFSMCTITTLFLDEIYSNNHVLSFTNNIKSNNSRLLSELRLDNLLWHNQKVNSNISDEILNAEWQLYKGIKWNGMVTIQPDTITDDDVHEELGEYKKRRDTLDSLLDYIDE